MCHSDLQLGIACLDCVDLGLSFGINELQELPQIEDVVHERFLFRLLLVYTFLKRPIVPALIIYELT